MNGYRSWTRLLAFLMMTVSGCGSDGSFEIGGSEGVGRGSIGGTIVNALNVNQPMAVPIGVSIRGAETHDLVAELGFFGVSGLRPGGYSVTINLPAEYEMVIGTSASQNVLITSTESRHLTFRVRPATINQVPVPPQARN